MDLSKHIAVQKECENRRDHFTKIDFPIIAESFRKASESLAEMISVLTKLNELAEDANVTENASVTDTAAEGENNG